MAYTIDINGAIGDFENDKVAILNKLREANGKDVALNISSLGGNVDDAFAIYDALKAYEGKTVAKLTGFVASAATIIAMGADEVLMSENALFLVHKCSVGIMLFGGYNADDIDGLIADLESIKDTNKKVDLIIANIYAKNTGKRAKSMLDLMGEEKWLNYDEALSYGFISGKLQSSRSNMSAIAASIASHNLPPIPENYLNQSTMDLTPITNAISELKNLIAGIGASKDNGVVEVKIMDNAEVSAKIASIEASLSTAQSEIEAKGTEIETLTASIVSKDADIAAKDAEIVDLKNKLTLAGIKGSNAPASSDPDPSGDVKKTEDQLIFSEVMGSVTPAEKAMYSKKK